MSVLDSVLEEEYVRLKRIRKVTENEIMNLPAGYISKKRINGKIYYYLQKRHGGKVVSSYISNDDIEEVERKISRRKQLEASLKDIDKSMRKIKRVVK